MIYLYIVFISLSAPLIYYFIYITYRKVSFEYRTLLLYTIGITILPGIIISPFLYNTNERLINISLETTITISLLSFYYLVAFITPIYLWGSRKNDNKITANSYDEFAANIILTISFLYFIFRIYIFHDNIPLFHLLENDLASAAKYRQLIQNKILNIDFPYIGATIKILTNIVVYYYFYHWIKNNTYCFRFLLSLIIAGICLFLDTQKAPLFIMIMNMLLIYTSIKKINFKVIFSSSLSLTLLLFLVLELNGSRDVTNSLFSIFDRVILGQIQSMYYMFEFLTPNSNGIIYDFYFSSFIEHKSLPPNIEVIPFIPTYENNSNLVNVNTFYLGDVWGYWGWIGVAISPIIVFIIFTLNLFYMRRISNNYLYLFLSLSFFSFFPLNRSFSEILFLKYFLHYLIFGYIPLSIILMLSKKFKRTQ